MQKLSLFVVGFLFQIYGVLAGVWIKVLNEKDCVCRWERICNFCWFNTVIIILLQTDCVHLTPFNCKLIADWLFCLFVVLLPSWRTKVTLKMEADYEWLQAWSPSSKQPFQRQQDQQVYCTRLQICCSWLGPPTAVVALLFFLSQWWLSSWILQPVCYVSFSQKTKNSWPGVYRHIIQRTPSSIAKLTDNWLLQWAGAPECYWWAWWILHIHIHLYESSLKSNARQKRRLGFCLKCWTRQVRMINKRQDEQQVVLKPNPHLLLQTLLRSLFISHPALLVKSVTNHPHFVAFKNLPVTMSPSQQLPVSSLSACLLVLSSGLLH